MAIEGIRFIEEESQKQSSYSTEKYLNVGLGEEVLVFPSLDADGKMFVNEYMHKIIPKSADKNAYPKKSACWHGESCPLCELKAQGLKDFEGMQSRTAILVYMPDEDVPIKIFDLWSKWMSPLATAYTTLIKDLIEDVMEDDEEIALKIEKVVDSVNFNVDSKTVDKIITLLDDDNKLKKYIKLFRNPFYGVGVIIKKGDSKISPPDFATKKRREKFAKQMEKYIEENEDCLISLSDMHFKPNTITQIEKKYGGKLPLKKTYENDENDDDYDDYDDDDDLNTVLNDKAY